MALKARKDDIGDFESFMITKISNNLKEN